MSLVQVPPRAAPFFLGKKAVLGVVELFVVPCHSTSYLVVFTYIHIPVCDMLDRRLVIIPALYLSIHSVFVDVMHSANHRSRSECILVVFFIIEQWFVFLLSLVPSTHLHHAEAHFTLLISAHPAISPHSLRLSCVEVYIYTLPFQLQE